MPAHGNGIVFVFRYTEIRIKIFKLQNPFIRSLQINSNLYLLTSHFFHPTDHRIEEAAEGISFAKHENRGKSPIVNSRGHKDVLLLVLSAIFVDRFKK